MQVNKQSEKTGKTRTLTIIGILTLTIMTAIVGVMIGRNLTHTRSATSPTATPETSSPTPMQEPQSSPLPKVPTPSFCCDFNVVRLLLPKAPTLSTHPRY